MALKLPSVTLSRKMKILLGIAVVLLLAAGAVLFVLYSRKVLFTENPRLLLKKIVVKNAGWWAGKEDYVARKLDLKKGAVYLFSLDLDQLRKKLEEESCIEKVVIARELPDTLCISIMERIPRAMLHSLRSSRVLDSECVVMEREKCMNITGTLPVIFGFRANVPAFGEKFGDLKPAMDLIMATVADYPEFRILSINAREAGTLHFSMIYRGSTSVIYRVHIPVKDMKRRLNALSSGMPEIIAGSSGKKQVDVDLRYDGKITLK